MPHVALITTSYPEQSPGAEAAGSFVEDFAHELANYVRVTVIAAGTRASRSDDGNLSIRRFPVARLPLSLLRPLNPRDWLPIARSLRAGRASLESLVSEDRPDHVLALWALPSGYWARKVGARYNVSYSIWALGSDIWSLGKIPLVRQALAAVLRDAERRYADGLELARDVETIAQQPCGFLPSARRLPRRAKVRRDSGAGRRLAFLGRWHPNKGVDMLLDALGELRDEDWIRIEEVRIFGGGPLQDRVSGAASQLVELGRPVSVGGYLGKDAAADLIAWADYLLLPSRIESIPVIFSDAMQLGTPIISTPVGDLPGIYARHAVGVMAASAEAPDFARSIRAALDEDPRKFALSIEQAGKDFDVTEIVRRFVADLGVTGQ